MYNVLKITRYSDGATLRVVQTGEATVVAYLSNVNKDGITTLYRWVYEGRSYQSVMRWANKVRKTPLECRYFESGIYAYPHNDGRGNYTGKRKCIKHGLIL